MGFNGLVFCYMGDFKRWEDWDFNFVDVEGVRDDELLKCVLGKGVDVGG